MNMVLRGVTLYTGDQRDLFVSGTRLVDAEPPAAQVVDARGLIALPGLVDPHTHLREPADDPAETIASGTAAAARGGYTAVAAMPNTTPACNSPTEVRWLLNQTRAVGASARVVPIGAVTLNRAGRELADLTGMAEAGVRLFSDDGAAVTTPDLLRAALLAVKGFEGAVADHCQNPELAGAGAWNPNGDWPVEAETSIVARDLEIAQETGGHIHLCHLSCAQSVEMVRQAKTQGVNVTAEVTPHHLLLTADNLAGGNPAFKVNPPLREALDVEALRDGLADGTIDMLGTDHAPHRGADKA